MKIIKINSKLFENATNYLSSKEVIYFEALPQTPKNRKLEWLTGRIAAKQEIKKYFNAQGKNLNYHEIEIETKKGQPYFQNLKVSISHNQNYAAADVSNRGLIGIDIETV